MKSIKFRESNCIYAEHQPEYQPLSVHKTKDGAVTSCWRLNIKERAKLLFTGKIYMSVLTFGGPLQPQMLTLNFDDGDPLYDPPTP